MFRGARILETRRAQELLDRLRRAVHHDHVTQANDLVSCRARKPYTFPGHADQVHIVLIGQRLQVSQLLADRAGSFRHCPFRDVPAQVHQLFCAVHAATRDGDQSPADQRDVGDPDDCHDETDRREIEHAVRLSNRVLPEGCNNDVRWRADQGDHPAENRGERQRHQCECRTSLGLPCGLHVDRHQQGKRGNVIHDCAERGSDGGHNGDVQAESA